MALGKGCPDRNGVVPRVGASHPVRLGGRIDVNLSRTVGGARALLILGLSSSSWGNMNLPVDLGPIGMPGCLLRVSVDSVSGVTTAGPRAKGRATVPVDVPADPALRGRSFHAQWLVLDLNGPVPSASATGALRFTIQ